MRIVSLSFDGSLLERGFWLYVWKITHQNNVVFYVGRTGDSSSQYAASPFNRVGQHLDMRATATANTLLRNIKSADLNPLECHYEMIALGPIYPEQHDIEKHRVHLDIIAPLETALALHLKEIGKTVIGSHGKKKPYDEVLFSGIKEKFLDELQKRT